MKFRVLPHLTISKVADDWDKLAPIRLQQILGGSDVTFNNVMLPEILNLLIGEKYNSILDAGCGVGVLTSYLTNRFDRVVGIDPSPISVDIAKSIVEDSASMHCASIEEYSISSISRKFDVVMANMVLMDAPNIDSFCSAVYRTLRPRGSFIFSITHPCFWPMYYGYSDESWYKYSRVSIVESPFRISSEQDCRILSTHIHRPVERYMTALKSAGLFVESIIEPFPSQLVQQMYPIPWKYPRYMLVKCRRDVKIPDV
jgi:SAM-dependent methyltransferase